jgi:NADH-quinone oxidoreductase subunit E
VTQAAPKAAASNGQAPSAATKPAQAKAAKAASPAPASKPDSGKAKSGAPDAAKSTAPKAADKPKGLTKARGGKPDDLKLIKGVGPKLEALCNKLGFYHFDQIASWTEKEIAWVDDNLEGFKGRVTREDWVQQARDLMNGLPPRPGGEK